MNLSVPEGYQGSGTAWAARENAKVARRQQQEAEAAKDLRAAFACYQEARTWDAIAAQHERLDAPVRRMLHCGVIRGRRVAE